MRAIIVTSALTFVPANYDEMVLGVADHPSITGLLILDNRHWKQVVQALVLILTLSSPRLGWQILKNYFGRSLERRKLFYEALNKKVWMLDSINSEQALNLIAQENIDLIINARTRFIYKEKILKAPRLGCVNIHHGLLPVQRGLMCDFWSHLEKSPFGFSFHKMTSEIDDGPILEVVQSQSSGRNFLESLYEGSKLEAVACKKILTQIEDEDRLPVKEKGFHPLKDILGTQIIYRKNPRLSDGYLLQSKGVKI